MPQPASSVGGSFKGSFEALGPALGFYRASWGVLGPERCFLGPQLAKVAVIWYLTPDWRKVSLAVKLSGGGALDLVALLFRDGAFHR